MKLVKKIVLVILLLPILLVLISLFLPAHYRVARSLTIKASPETIFAHLNNLKKWPEWTAWTVARYPDMIISFAGPESGVGATYSWEGKTSGNGTLRLTSSEPNRGIRYELDFEHGKYLSKGTISLQPTAETVQVTWSNEGDLGWNPVSRYAGLLMDKMMGPDLETGLNNLRRRTEGK